MLTILEKATLATKQQNWSLVNQYLGELPLSKKVDQPLKLSETQQQQVLDLALQVLKVGDFEQRWEIAKLFRQLGKTAITPLIDILEDEETDLEIRWFALRILGQFKQPEVIIALVKILQNSSHEELASTAAQSLAEIGDGAVEALDSFLQQDNYELKFLAVNALSYIRRPQVIEPLLAIIQDPYPEIRAIAIETLGSFHHPRITSILLAALEDKSAQVRKEAVSALGFQAKYLPDLNLTHAIKPLLYDLNLEVCQRAINTLGRLATPEAIEALFVLLQSPVTPLHLKIATVRSLAWTGNQLALGYLSETLTNCDLETQVCAEIVMMLGRWEKDNLKPQVSQILLDFLNSGQETAQKNQIQQIGAFSLGQLGQSSAINTLQKLAQQGNHTVQLHALAALKKVTSL